MTNLITLADNVQIELQLGRTNGVFSSSQTSAIRSLRYLNATGKDLAQAYDWQALWRSHSFTAVSGQSQSSGFPSDFGRMIPETFYTSNGDMIVGPVTPQEWAQLQSVTATPLEKRYIRRDGTMMVYPGMSGGEVCSYEYVTDQWCESDAGVGRTEFQFDGDVSRMDDELMVTGAAAMWLLAEGLPADHMISRFNDRFKKLTDNDNPQAGMMSMDSALLSRGGVSSVGRHYDGVPPSRYIGRGY